MSLIEKRINKLIVNHEFGGNTPAPYFMNPSAAFVTLTTEDAAIGDWTEIEGAALQDCLIVGVVAVPNTIDEIGTVQIGIGASESEVAKITFPTQFGITLDALFIQFPKPIVVHIGERVVGRFFTDTNSGTCLVKLVCVGGRGIAREGGAGGSPVSKNTLNALVDGVRQTVYTVIPLPAATTFLITPIAATPTSWTAGAWAELEDVTLTYDYWITHIVICNSATPGTYFEVDVGIGAEGDEVAVASTPAKLVDANNLMIVPLMTPVPVRVGSRIAARARGSATTAIEVAVIVARGLSN